MAYFACDKINTYLVIIANYEFIASMPFLTLKANYDNKRLKSFSGDYKRTLKTRNGHSVSCASRHLKYNIKAS